MCAWNLFLSVNRTLICSIRFFSLLDYSCTNSLRWPQYPLSGLNFKAKIAVKINLIVTKYFPDSLAYSCPHLAVLVFFDIIGACCVIPMTLFLDPTHHTVVFDVPTVSVGPEIYSNVTDVFTIHPLGFCLPLSF